MAGEGHFKKPINFSTKDLSLDVNLTACFNGTSRDFMGRETFNTSFFKKNIGFGITDVSIEISPSLQPVIEITFKDLYGNTVFGTQRASNESIDTSVLFAWPPPKFIFSFKGYLGRKVTWLLNLKTTNVSYVSSDGSYNIKCSFVPNQWGFFADLPFLYLIAAKKLRGDYSGKRVVSCDGKPNKNDSIFSLIRVGKHVNIKTKEITKEFDALKKQITALKYDASNAVFGAKLIDFGEEVLGIVDTSRIKGFQNFEILSESDEISEKLEESSKNDDLRDRVNTYILTRVVIDNGDGIWRSVAPNQRTDTLDIVLTAGVGLYTNIKEKKKRVIKMLDANLDAIDREIQKRIYVSSKSQIAKLTIGEVLNQIAKDSGFILGLILEKGFKGYGNNKTIRDDNEKSLIGKSFPLEIIDGVEVPATSKNYGIDLYERAFIDEFVTAISKGIAENLLIDGEFDEDKLKTRINNAEMLRGNPYKPFYMNIVENLIIRSGIIAYVTRSDDPNHPGDFPFDGRDDNDKVGNMKTISSADMENLSLGILAQLSEKDKLMLKRFCRFFTEAFRDDGTVASNDYNLNLHGLNVPSVILDYSYLIDEAFIGIDFYDDTVDSYEERIAKMDAIKPEAERETLSFRQLFLELMGKATETESYGEGEHPEFLNMSYLHINNDGNGTYDAYLVKNNGVYYSVPNSAGIKRDKYYYVIFEGDDVNKLKDVSSSRSDSEFTEEQSDENDAKGIAYITTNVIETRTGKKTPKKIRKINDRIEAEQALSASSMLKHHTTIDANGREVFCNVQYLWPPWKTIKNKDGDGEVEANSLAFTVYTHTAYSDNVVKRTANGFSEEGDTNEANFLVSGMLHLGKKSRNQRVVMRNYCETILKKFDEMNAKANLVIGNIAGKAFENADAIYKQMHTIFHQWQSIALFSSNEPCGGLLKNYEGLAGEIEEVYGGCSAHIERPLNEKIKDKVDSIDDASGNKRSTVFIYDYPLGPINNRMNFNVKDSIINVEPIYKPNGSTTVLNIIQQICTKNNFIFVPFPGDPGSDNIEEVYQPFATTSESRMMNYFHVIFAPTPETRTKLSNDSSEMLTDYLDYMKSQIGTDTILVEFGSVENQIFKGINVGTDTTKPTVESILNLQRLVDKENTNKGVKMDCSMLPVLEGRSYKATIDMLGSSQVYPMQYFFINNMPLFGGLYQIMKVTHSITPNNMDTTMEGIRMRFSVGGGFGGIEPVTLDYLESLTENSLERVYGTIELPEIIVLADDEEQLGTEEKRPEELNQHAATFPYFNDNDNKTDDEIAKSFVEKFYLYALKANRAQGGLLAASYLLVQAAHETTWGTGAINGTNLWGVKEPNSDKPRVVATTHEYLTTDNQADRFPWVYSIKLQAPGTTHAGEYRYDVDDWFALYDTPENAFANQVARLVNPNGQYASCLEKVGNVYDYFYCLISAGYATADPATYANICVEKYNMMKPYLPEIEKTMANGRASTNNIENGFTINVKTKKPNEGASFIPGFLSH